MALGIFNWLLPEIGIEAAESVTGALDAGLEKLFGKSAQETLDDVAARLRAYTGKLPPNHDLERALRIIQLTSSLMVLRAYEASDELNRLDERGHLPHPFIAETRNWLHAQLGLWPPVTMRDNPALVAAMEQSLDALLRSGSPAQLAASRLAEAESAVWDELVAGGAAGEPPLEFRERFLARWQPGEDGPAGWRDAFRALMQEAMKAQPSVQIAFVVSRLAALRDDSVALRPILDALTGDVRALSRGVAAEATRAAQRHADAMAFQQTLPDQIEARVMAALVARGVVPRAEAEGLERRTIFALARRLKATEELDLDEAVAEVTRAVEIAVRTIRRGKRPSNEDAFVDLVLADVARRTQLGDVDGASRAVDKALAEMDAREAEQHAAMRRSRIALLEAGIDQDTLRRDAPGVAARVEALAALDHPGSRATWSATFLQRQSDFFREGRDRG